VRAAMFLVSCAKRGAIVSSYDLSVLNDKEFEILACDLLSEHFKVRIERFKPGKDKGVDGRWFATSGREVVVQCKHWIRSSFDSLIANLASKEQKKIEKLRPQRYIFVCSHELSRANKQRICDVLTPHVKSPSDIFGREDLEDLIKRFPAIERAHPKLWLTSSSVLISLLNNNVLGRSTDALFEIKTALSRYVDTADAANARQRLEQLRVLIIKGEPGVGKTTLAQQLVTESVAEGYQLVMIERDISEAEGVFDTETSQIFYFDDFLGRNFLEALDNNKDSHILHFIKRVIRTKKKRFILTTRTHILDRGKQLSELFAIEKIERNEFELSVGKLSRLEKGRLLYAHMWSSGLPDWAIDQLYEDRRYLKIVDHRNFNPRLISFITDGERLSETEPNEYWNVINSTLDFPKAIWGHVFDNQLAPDSRDVAVLTAYNGGNPIDQGDLEEAFLRLHNSGGESSLGMRQRFSTGLKLALGSVLTRTIDAQRRATCSLFNPSVADYLLGNEVFLSSVTPIVRALRTKSAFSYLQSLVYSDIIEAQIALQTVTLIAKDLRDEGIFATDLSMSVAEFLWNESPERVRSSEDFECMVSKAVWLEDGGNVSGTKLDVLLSYIESGQMSDATECFQEICNSIESIEPRQSQLEVILSTAKKLDLLDDGARYENVQENIVNLWEENASSMAKEDDVLDEYFSLQEAGESSARLETYFEEKADYLGIALTSSDLSRLVSAVDLGDIVSHNIDRAAREEYDGDVDRSGEEDQGDVTIVDYFDRSENVTFD